MTVLPPPAAAPTDRAGPPPEMRHAVRRCPVHVAVGVVLRIVDAMVLVAATVFLFRPATVASTRGRR